MRCRFVSICWNKSTCLTTRRPKYDDAGRINVIEHKHSGTNLLTLDYNYAPDGFIDRIDQTLSGSSTVYSLNYEYDKRGRLIREHGDLPPVPTGEGGSGVATAINIEYSYDQVGNRLTKEDFIAETLTTYTYDVHDQNYQHTHNNRLVKTVTVSTDDAHTIEEVRYAYTRGGHVKRILKTTDPPADPTPYTMTCFDYDTNQQLWLARGSELEVSESIATCETALFAREFRHEGDGRRRYWTRERDPETLEPLDDSLGWHEFRGQTIYSDLSVDSSTGESSTSRRYLARLGGRLIGWREGTDWHFVHADHLGSVRLVTMPNASIGTRTNYSAFGEVLSSGIATGADAARSRYGYCGGWGYENDGPPDSVEQIGLLHVGARYYDPGLGRFLQRDPAGIGGGLNAYTYVCGSPPNLVDPKGRESISSVMGALGISAVIGTIRAIAPRIVAAAVRQAVGKAARAAVDCLAAGSRTTSTSKAAHALGIPEQDVRDAIHSIKNGVKHEGNPNIEIDLPSGDVYMGEENIGNIEEELGSMGRL